MEKHLVDYSHDRQDTSTLSRNEQSSEGSSADLHEQQALQSTVVVDSSEEDQQKSVRLESKEHDQRANNCSSRSAVIAEPVASGQICR